MKEVSSILMGGLGNYLFQISAAYAYGRKYGLSEVFNHTESSGPHQNILTYENNVLRKISLQSVRNKDVIQYNENGFHYQEIPEYPDKNILLYGYFQSEKYFKGYEEEIRTMFTSYEIELDDEIKDAIDNKNTCSIHVRRGDYLKSPNHHPTQNMNYYMKAIKKMPKDSLFLIFSDDIEWCKQNFPDLPEKFIFVEGNKDYEDLYIMSKCKNNIICNSTFSWWGAWLNNNKEKIIISPIYSKWFGSAYSNHDTRDLIPDTWIQL